MTSLALFKFPPSKLYILNPRQGGSGGKYLKPEVGCSFTWVSDQSLYQLGCGVSWENITVKRKTS